MFSWVQQLAWNRWNKIWGFLIKAAVWEEVFSRETNCVISGDVAKHVKFDDSLVKGLKYSIFTFDLIINNLDVILILNFRYFSP